MIFACIIAVFLGSVVFVGVAWTHCPKGIIRTLIDRKRLEKRNCEENSTWRDYFTIVPPILSTVESGCRGVGGVAQ